MSPLSVIMVITDKSGDSSVRVNGGIYTEGFPSGRDALLSSAAALRTLGVTESPDDILAASTEVPVTGQDVGTTTRIFTTTIKPIIM